MNELIKKAQTMLVYYPGMGGEYICSMKLHNRELFDKIWLTDNNRWQAEAFTGPYYPFLVSEAQKLQSLPNEFIAEQRLTFKTQKEAFDYLYKHGKNIQENYVFKEPKLNNAWLMAHWHFGLWEDHWRWIDWDNDNWLTHWSICSGFKISINYDNWFGNNKLDFGYFRGTINCIKTYREYYRKHFPNNSFNIDKEDGESVNYKDWAKKNIEALHNQDAYKNNIIPDEILETFYNVI